MTTKRVLAIHDLCSFGRCSLTAAIPVISAMGFQVCPFPTAIFSNNLTYGDFTFSDFTPHMTEFMDKWQKLGYEYDAIYSGFLADAGQSKSFPMPFPALPKMTVSSSLTRPWVTTAISTRSSHRLSFRKCENSLPRPR